MTEKTLRELLARVANGEVSAEQAVVELKHLPFEDLGFARVDHHRQLRQGTAEVIYGAGKTPEQIAAIAGSILNHDGNVLVTRTDRTAFDEVRRVAEDAEFHPGASIITVVRHAPEPLGTVGVLCAGTSDLPVAEEAAVSATFLGAEVTRVTDVGVAGIHRLLDEKVALDNLDVAIVVAGMEGALPSVVGGLVDVPLIAVPTSVGYGASFGGIAALLGMLNSCAAGVAVVNIDNGFGAAAAAHRILRLRKR
jgi:NCAIR mutase (PurE)-related protein